MAADKPPRTLRLVLSEEQSAAIRESGIRFAVVHPGSWPDHPGRWLVELIECDRPTADAAARVALGQARAVSHPKTSTTTKNTRTP